MILQYGSLQPHTDVEPIIVEKVHPDGYMLLNGHHRWAAAMRLGFEPVPISIVNLTQETDIERMVRRSKHDKRVTLDLDEVLFVSPKTHKTEPPLPFPLNKYFRERLRLGTPELIHALQERGDEVWVYTSSFRSERYIRTLFRLYGVVFDGVVNGTRHLNEVQRKRAETLPQKLPPHYHISLHIDDESVIASYGRQYGFDVFLLEAQDDDWKEKVLARADQVRKRALAQESRTDA